jgi:ubiquinone biosynthesis protein
MNQRIVTIALKHNIMLPSSFVLLERALMQIEGVCKDLNPDFDIVDIAQQNFAMMIRSRYKLRLDPLHHLETAHKYKEFLKNLPHRADKVLKKLENDEIKITVDTGFVDEFKHHLRRTVLILAVSLIAASLVIYVAWAGNVTELGLVPTSASIIIILLIWVATVAIIHRRP